MILNRANNLDDNYYNALWNVLKSKKKFLKYMEMHDDKTSCWQVIQKIVFPDSQNLFRFGSSMLNATEPLIKTIQNYFS